MWKPVSITEHIFWKRELWPFLSHNSDFNTNASLYLAILKFFLQIMRYKLINTIALWSLNCEILTHKSEFFLISQFCGGKKNHNCKFVSCNSVKKRIVRCEITIARKKSEIFIFYSMETGFHCSLYIIGLWMRSPILFFSCLSSICEISLSLVRLSKRYSGNIIIHFLWNIHYKL